MQVLYSADTIIGAGTTVLVNSSCFVASIIIVCSAGGLTLQVRDRSTPPRVLVPSMTYSPPTNGKPNIQFEFQNPENGVRMVGGVDAVATTPTGSPQVDVWVTAVQSDNA